MLIDNLISYTSFLKDILNNKNAIPYDTLF